MHHFPPRFVYVYERKSNFHPSIMSREKKRESCTAKCGVRSSHKCYLLLIFFVRGEERGLQTSSMGTNKFMERRNLTPKLHNYFKWQCAAGRRRWVPHYASEFIFCTEWWIFFWKEVKIAFYCKCCYLKINWFNKLESKWSVKSSISIPFLLNIFWWEGINLDKLI